MFFPELINCFIHTPPSSCHIYICIVASGQPQSGDIVETIPCRSCYIHPDSRDENLAYCDEDTVECPAHEGCWVSER